MTTTPIKLTGTALIETIDANLETHDVWELIELTGYEDVKEWSKAVQDAKHQELEEAAAAKAKARVLCETLDVELDEVIEKNNDEAIARMVGHIGGITYRWLTYEYALQNGFEDDRLAAQQDEFAEEILHETKLLRVLLGQDAGMVITDALLIQTNLLAYVRAEGWKVQGDNGTVVKAENHEEWMAIVERIRDWAWELPLLQEMIAIGDLGMPAENVEAYQKQQRPRLALITLYLRSQMLDFVNGTTIRESEAYKERLDEANLYIHYLERNCPWTPFALRMVVYACLKYDYRTEEPEQAIQFAVNTIDTMVDNGKAFGATLKN